MSAQDDTTDIRIVDRGDILEVTLANPAARNAQTPATWRRLAGIPELLSPQIRAVVLRAEGPSFSAGLDRRMLTPEGVPGEMSLLGLAGMGEAGIDDFIRQAQAAFTWWREVPQITVALVQGHAIGAGFQLALACDLMVVADDAQLAMRETSLGLVPDLAGTEPLVERVGYSRAFEICASGRFVSAAEAVSSGLAVARANPDQWDDTLDALLGPMLAALPGAVGELKSLLRGAASAPDQPARERAAQVRRLAELADLLSPRPEVR